MDKLNKLALASWVLGCAATILSGDIKFFTIGLFLAIFLFLTSGVISHFFKVN